MPSLCRFQAPLFRSAECWPCTAAQPVDSQGTLPAYKAHSLLCVLCRAWLAARAAAVGGEAVAVAR